jgi:N-acetylneuraminate synthase
LTFQIGGHEVGLDSPPLFIADIAANHDGDLNRAVHLIDLAAKAGAHVAKFQHFSAETLVSDFGFRSLGGKQSHQSAWHKSVFEVYKDASIDLSWTQTLVEACRDAGIAFMSTPYSIELADHIDPFVDAYKIGSGDINYPQIIAHVARTGKPWLIATGAATLEDVRAAVGATGSNRRGVIMQCNTNYTADPENLKFINLRVLESYKNEFPDLVLGLSDHTLGHATVLGAVALGARVFEKHFTDDRSRLGPDHHFSMMPNDWREMVEASNQLFFAMGDGEKRVEANELDTVVLQRRSIRVSRDLAEGETLSLDMLDFLRPAPRDSIPPSLLDSVVGKKLATNLKAGEHLTWQVLI